MREGQSVLGEPVLFALDVWKGGRQGPAGRLAPGSALFDRGWELVELVSGPWGSHAHSANTEGRWGAPGNVPDRGPQNNVVVKH